jgi:hypothetical protein
MGSGERRTLNSGKSWMRWLMIPIGFFAILHVFEHPDSWLGFVVFILAIVFFFGLKRARKLEYDDINLYSIRDTKEQVIPFTSIISIKRSKTKVNGSRFWILQYEIAGEQRKIRYFREFFNKEFLELVTKENPKVIVWTHPHFNH